VTTIAPAVFPSFRFRDEIISVMETMDTAVTRARRDA
jgi:hypothetical protein